MPPPATRSGGRSEKDSTGDAMAVPLPAKW